jgi:hypothetical protein
MRRYLPASIAVVVLLGLLALAVAFTVQAWQRIDAQLSIHGWIALGLGVLFSLVIGCGLMALIFYSSRHGYDERLKNIDFHREVP